MNKFITVYELLGLIKDGKAPKKIKWENMEWNYDIENNEYFTKYKKYYWLFEEYIPNNVNFMDCLNDKVEILEEDKPIIEKIEINKYNFHNTNHSKLLKNQQMLETKLNEIIDHINRKEK